MKNNIIIDTDSYKVSHWKQYPPGTTHMFSYIESRGGKFNHTVMFGLQYLLKEYLEGVVVTKEDVEEAATFYAKHGVPFNAEGWLRIATVHGGKLPVRIRAVPEGTVVPTLNALVTIESTDPETFWVASWLETMLVRLWYPVNVATISYNARKLIGRFLEETSDAGPGEVLFKLHDFGSRGVSSQESAALGGAAHLVNFLGSDTVVGVKLANDYYNCDMAGFSIPAAEHSTMTSWGRGHEEDAYRNMLKVYGGEGKLLAVVSDSYDIFHACEFIWGEKLKQQVIDSGSTLVIRPDSGDPKTVVLKVLEILGEKFGYTKNSKGFRVLKYVRVIQGDGVNLNSIEEILKGMAENKWSAENLAFGMGGGLLQQHNRDTQKFAMKCCAVTVNGELVEVYKQPVTDTVKKSKKGRLDLVKRRVEGSHGHTEIFETVNLGKDEIAKENTAMKTVFENGEILVEYTLDEIRKRAWG
jgi:nicotinamide phosphoribosyltransferase